MQAPKKHTQPKKIPPRERIARFLHDREPLRRGAPGGIPRRVRSMLRAQVAPHRPRMVVPGASAFVLGEHLLRIAVDTMGLAQRATMNGTSLRPSLGFILWLLQSEPAFNGRPAVDPGPWILGDAD